jgi:hypothetical protein
LHFIYGVGNWSYKNFSYTCRIALYMQSYCYLHKPLYSSGIWTGLFSPPDISHSNFCRFTLCPPGTFRTCFASSSWVTWQNGKYTYSGSALVFPLIHWGLIWYTYALIVWIKCKWYHRDVLGPDNAIHGIVILSSFVKSVVDCTTSY